MKKIKFCFLVLMFLMFFALGKDTFASSDDITVRTYNCPGIQDWEHTFIKQDLTKTYMAENVTGWIKKDSYNDIVVTYQESVSGTISYSASTTDSIKVGAELMGEAINAAAEYSSEVTRTLSYSYTETTMKSFTWTISPDEPGNYFCIAVNYKIRNYKVDHKKQEFKLFGQGEYVYEYTSEIDIPTEKYLAKNYRYEIDGTIYER